jgi:single-stranded-DNA-specific exonuclease
MIFTKFLAYKGDFVKYVVKSKRSLDRMTDERLLEELLEMRGVTDPLSLLRVDSGHYCDYYHSAYDFTNMEQGLDLLWKHLDNEFSHIHLIFDVDVDGLTSGALYYLWHKERYSHIPITFDCNEGKRHGLNFDITERIPKETTLLIIPDSSSSDVIFHEELYSAGYDILILDHHEFDIMQPTSAIIVNCMDGKYPNTNLTGVGVVYKFLEQYELDLAHDLTHLNSLLPLVTLGQLADLADVRNLETRGLCLQGLEDFTKNNLLLKAIVEEQEYSMKGECNFTTISWYVAPLMNAIFRQGSLEDRIDLFKAICNFEEERVYIPQRKTKDNPNKEPIVESLQKNIIRRAKSIKSHQDNEVKKEVKEIQQLIDETDKVIIVDITGIVSPGHSGLIANRLAHQYKRPVILVNDKGGSGRGYDEHPIENFNEWISQSGLIECSGHGNAFGITFTREQIPQLKEWCNEQLQDVDTEPIWHVDFEFDITKLKESHVKRVGQFNSSWGGFGMEEPLFAITGIQIETGDIQRLGAKATMMKFTTEINGQEISFIRPFTGDEVYKEFVCENAKRRGISRDSVGNKKIEVTLIGKFKINEFGGKQFAQIEIVEFDTKIATQKRQRRF